MKHLHNILLLALLALASCQDERLAQADQQTTTVSLGLTVEGAYGTPQSFRDQGGQIQRVGATRADNPGDPGTEPEYPAPANLYIFTFLKNPSNDTYFFNYEQREDLTDASWTLENNTSAQYANTRYRLNQNVSIRAEGMGSMSDYDEGTVGRTFAIATPRDKRIKQTVGTGGLFTQWFGDISSLRFANATADQTSINVIGVSQTDYNAFLNLLENGALLDCSDANLAANWVKQDGTTTADPWTSDDYRDLYSTPVGDNSDNGTFVWQSGTLHQNDIRLYHAAAKYDFQWEVAEQDANGNRLRNETDGVFLRKINLVNLPTQCNIFNPSLQPTITTPISDDLTLVHTNVLQQTYTSATTSYEATGMWDYSTTPATPLYSATSANENGTLQWEGIDPSKRDQLFLGRAYIYGLQPHYDDATNTFVYYQVELCTADNETEILAARTLANDPIAETDLGNSKIVFEEEDNFTHEGENYWTQRYTHIKDVQWNSKEETITYGSNASAGTFSFRSELTETGKAQQQYQRFLYTDAARSSYHGFDESDYEEIPATYQQRLTYTQTNKLQAKRSVEFTPDGAFTTWVRVRAMVKEKKYD